MYLLPASGNIITTFDDPSVSQDSGVDFTARLVTVQRTMGAWTQFRMWVQEIFVGTSATVTATPINDGSENSMNKITATRTAPDNGSQRIEFPFASFGTRSQVAIEVPAHVGLVELGSVELVLIKRRKQLSYAP
jgi:hypothetical protein